MRVFNPPLTPSIYGCPGHANIGNVMTDTDAQAVDRDHAISGAPSLLSVPSGSNAALCKLALCWLAPWSRSEYPGLRKVTLALLPRPYTWQAVQHWRTGRRELPADVAEALARQIEARALAGLALVTDLRSHAKWQDARPKRMVGCCVVREDGRDRRGNWRR